MPRGRKRKPAPEQLPAASPQEPFSTDDQQVVQRLSGHQIYPEFGTGTPMRHAYRLADAERIRQILADG